MKSNKVKTRNQKNSICSRFYQAMIRDGLPVNKSIWPWGVKSLGIAEAAGARREIF
jgi:hypothetical protein